MSAKRPNLTFKIATNFARYDPMKVPRQLQAKPFSRITHISSVGNMPLSALLATTLDS